jgi:hypothetical protein
MSQNCQIFLPIANKRKIKYRLRTAAYYYYYYYYYYYRVDENIQKKIIFFEDLLIYKSS